MFVNVSPVQRLAVKTTSDDQTVSFEAFKYLLTQLRLQVALLAQSHSL